MCSPKRSKQGFQGFLQMSEMSVEAPPDPANHTLPSHMSSAGTHGLKSWMDIEAQGVT
jgi:hypothetical protein